MGSSLELGQIGSFLRTTPSVLRVFAGGLPEQAAAWHPGAGKWCMREVIGHLTEEDKRDFIGRIRLMLDQKEPHLPVTDQEEVARMRRDCYKDIDCLLQEFAVVRTESVAFVSKLEEAMLDRWGIHPKIGRLRIIDLLHEWIYHDLNHLRQISATIQSLLWEHLGNMQGFYKS